MKPSNLFFIILLIADFGFCFSQKTIDVTAPIGNEKRNFHYYIPTQYIPNETKAVLAFHPYNPSRWTGKTWRDSLIDFAEQNNLMLICPDGGTDSKIEYPQDSIAIGMALQLQEAFYPYAKNELIALGFSWGGRTVYSFALNSPKQLQGYIPIGAAIDRLNPVVYSGSSGVKKKFYIIHGSGDDIQNRFYPIKNWLISEKACVQDSILPGIDHTFDFPNRNQILSAAYQHLMDSDCDLTNQIESKKEIDFILFQHSILMPMFDDKLKIAVFDMNGIPIKELKSGINSLDNVPGGVYFIRVVNSIHYRAKKMIIN
ncbi:MAG TPA: T9SS type A sorting domain-containing protein [Saprospiraceae bacterium]|nr:T9SS type A sorting domain-containing protein [Saprospiraceae bacterium]